MVFINSYLKDLKCQNKNASAQDIISVMFNKIRKKSSINLWAKNTPNYNTQLQNGLKKIPHWHSGMSRSELLPLETSVKHALFRALPQGEQERWEQMAVEDKNTEPDKWVTIRSVINSDDFQDGCMACAPQNVWNDWWWLPWSSEFQYHCLKWGKGSQRRGLLLCVSFIFITMMRFPLIIQREEFHGHVNENPFGFMSSENWHTIVNAFRDAIAKDAGGKMTYFAVFLGCSNVYFISTINFGVQNQTLSFSKPNRLPAYPKN